MYFNSNQQKNWVQKTEKDLAKIQTDMYDKYTLERRAEPSGYGLILLTLDEENLLTAYYEQRMREFCTHFKVYHFGEALENVRVPKHIVYASCMYFKRVYLSNSCMDLHPRLMMLGCVWLAMKIEEFNVKIDEFMYNIFDSKREAIHNQSFLKTEGDDMLAVEYHIMRALNFELIVHSPVRPLEGFLLEMKPLALKLGHHNLDFAMLSARAHQYLDSTFRTSCMLMFAPSQIALATLALAAKDLKKNEPRYNEVFGNYMKNFLLRDDEKRKRILKICKKIDTLIKQSDEKPTISKQQIEEIKQKLENCRRQLYNPKSREFTEALKSDDEDEYGSSQNAINDTLITIGDDELSTIEDIDHPDLLSY